MSSGLRIRLIFMVSFFLFLIPLNVHSEPNWAITQKPEPGFFPGQVWTKLAKPELIGWDSAKLKKARLYSRRFGSAAVMIVQDGVVVDAWGSLDVNFKCHSIRKSLISALFGIQAEKGNIKLDRSMAELGMDDDTPLTELEKQATVRHLLMARSGIYLPALGESPMMRYQKPERHSHAPGEYWYYNNWDFNALGSIYRQETGSDIFGDFQRDIAARIDMEDFDQSICKYGSHDMNQGIRGPKRRHQYYNTRLSARDLARFGLLYLRQGRWNDRQVIPAEWVAESTKSHSEVDKDSGYGYLWWTGINGGLLPGLKVSEPCYQASGYRGQQLIIMPYRKLVIVHRVDTDNTPYSVSSRVLGRLVWLILDAAGAKEIGEPSFMEAVPGRLLDESQIHSLIGQEVVLAPLKQPQIQVILDSKGGFRIQEAGSAKLLDQGRWWMEDKFFLTRLNGQKEECARVKEDGDLVHSFNAYGELRNSYWVIRRVK